MESKIEKPKTDNVECPDRSPLLKDSKVQGNGLTSTRKVKY